MIQQTDFFFEGGRSGVLLIHGLTGTPMEMKLLGKGLNRAGFTVHGMQLAGHCGDVEDLLATGWHDWYASVEKAADALREKVDHLFVEIGVVRDPAAIDQGKYRLAEPA